MRVTALERYLARYAEPEAEYALTLGIDRHEQCLVVPAFQEILADIDAVTAAIDQSFLLILVVNAPVNDTATVNLLAEASSRGQVKRRSGNLEYVVHKGQHVVLVDRCSPDHLVPHRQGVGLSRKIGADIACALMSAGHLAPGLIHMSDADAQLPAGYFDPGTESSTCAAMIYPFEHETEDDAAREAALLYEIALLYYVAGLKHARSSWAWPTIGSTLAVDAMHYAMVRGFPKRNAAEDFYLLNKLAKTGDITQLPGPVISIRARPSTRVPFGTGPAIREISALDDPLTEYRYYHPEIFTHLSALLELLDAAWEGFEPGELPEPAEKAIEQMGLMAFLASAKARTRTREVFDKAVSDWFDAFRTLKFVHFLRDNHLPSVTLDQIVGSTILPAVETADSSLPAIRNALAARCFEPTC
jgi:hypothetical protein